MALRRRTRFILLGLLALLALSPISPLYWWLAHIYYEPAKREAMQFCESLTPQIETSRRETGTYPSAADPAWLRGRRIPKLIRPKHFYMPTATSYILYFWNPGDFMDDFWALDGATKQWSNYDSEKPRD